MIDLLNDNKVGLVKEKSVYNNISPYHSSELYPEFKDYPVSKSDNPAYRGVRELFRLLKFDYVNYGTEEWNPLKEVVKKSDVVVIKPNLVNDRNFNSDVTELSLDCLITHGSVIRVVVDYVAKAMEGVGKIIIGDAPIQGADFERIKNSSGLCSIKEFIEKIHKNIIVELIDFRLAKAVLKGGKQVERILTENSFDDYTELDIGKESLLMPIILKGNYKFGVAQYSYKKMKYAHNENTNKYLFPDKVLNADVIINLPKLKSHKRAGVTCSLKNLVGIIGHKDYLPHFTYGSPKNGGDEYPDGGFLWDLRWFFEHKEWERNKGVLKRFYNKCVYLMRGILRKVFKYPDDFDHNGSGGWFGNDTLWRTVLDINRAFFYRKKNNDELSFRNDQGYLTIVDGIVGGDKNSPLAPSPVNCGLILGGFNPLCVDTVATCLMGFDIYKVKQICEAFNLNNLRLSNFEANQIEVKSSFGLNNIDDILKSREFVKFIPAKGFKGHIEYMKTDEK